jgi:hypothetical protein
MKSQTRSAWGSVVVVFVFGLLVGWFAIGWWAWPIKWINADPVDLRQPAREEYLMAVASDYAMSRDAEVALNRLGSWPSAEEAYREISDLAEYAQAQGRAETAQRLRQLAAVLPVAVGLQPAQEPPSMSYAKTLRTIVVAAAAIGLVALALLLFRRRGQTEPRSTSRADTIDRGDSATAGPEAMDDDALLDVLERPVERYVKPAEPERAESPIPRFLRRSESKREETWAFDAVYAGEGMEFDQTFTLERDGAYFGECGIGATTHLPQNPEQVSALEVWLFDKSDIRTIAKVLVSEQLYEDDTLVQELAARGDPVLAIPGTTIALEGNSIQANVRIERVEYLAGATARSAFARVVLRIQATKR